MNFHIVAALSWIAGALDLDRKAMIETLFPTLCTAFDYLLVKIDQVFNISFPYNEKQMPKEASFELSRYTRIPSYWSLGALENLTSRIIEQSAVEFKNLAVHYNKKRFFATIICTVLVAIGQDFWWLIFLGPGQCTPTWICN